MINSLVTEKAREFDELPDYDDSFNFRHLAKHLFQYIETKKFPISIGIYGKWGSGKSVLINFLKTYSKKSGIKVQIIDPFDIYTKESIGEELINRIVSKNTSSFILYILIILSLTLLCFFLYTSLVTTFLIFFSLTLVSVFLNYFSWDKFSNTDFNFLRKDFLNLANLKKDFLSSSYFLKRQIIVIDNLDRLPPKETLIFLEKMKAILLRKNPLWSKKIAYIIPCDFNILQNEVSAMYKDSKVDTRDYISKLIEISFPMPTYTHELTEGFMGKLLNQELSSEIRGKIINVFQHSDIFDTPRDIKALLMELDMIYVVSKGRGKWGEEELLKNLDKILAIHIVRSLFKELYGFLLAEARSGERASFFESKSRFTRYLYSPNENPEDKFKYKNHENKYHKLKHLLINVTKLVSGGTAQEKSKQAEEFLKLVEIVDSSTQLTKLELGGIGNSPLGSHTLGS